MSLWDTLKGWVDRDRAMLVYQRMDPAHVDRQVDTQPIQAGRHYFRLRLAGMFLRKEVEWFRSWYPAVHSVVRFNFGDQRVELPYIADSTRVGMQQNGRGDVVARNFMLTPAMAFNGGTVDLDAGLMSIQGQNYLNNFIQVLGSFASMLAVPQLSAVLNVAQPLANGIQELFGAGDGHLHLGLHESYAADDLRPGYIAVIRAQQQEVDTTRLWVLDDQLREGDGLGAGQNRPFERFDYLLLRLESFEERDDWESLTAIQEPFQEARRALKDLEDEKARFHLRTALVRALEARELTVADRRRVVTALKERFEQDRQDLGTSGLVGGSAPTLAEVMARPMSVDEALALGEPTYAEILSTS
jgi:hypothetical protein